MRIISGYLKGRKIQPPSGLRSRPTTDFAKEALFNILNNETDISQLFVLDLFCGSGSISFEFISRGAPSVWCVDVDRKSIDFIKKFKEKAGLENLKPVRAEAYQFLRTCSETFDLIFADPPYNHKHLSSLPGKIISSGVLKSNGLLIVEHGRETDYSDSEYFKFHRNYGNVNFSFFSYK